MKRLIATLFLLLPTLCFSQGFGSFKNDQPFLARDISSSTPSGPTAIPGLYRYWVASDVAIGETVTNQWLDRIASQPMAQMDLTRSPLAYGTSVWFSGSTYLTNTGVSIGAFPTGTDEGAIWVVFRVEASPGTWAKIVGKSDGYGATMATTRSVLCQGLGAGTAYTGVLPAAKVNDLTYSAVSTGAIIYTNSAQANTIVYAGVDAWPLECVGAKANTPDQFFPGQIMEIAIWTNHTITISEIQGLYNYRTNTYGL